jgi:hypothetical protein
MLSNLLVLLTIVMDTTLSVVGSGGWGLRVRGVVLGMRRVVQGVRRVVRDVR